MDRPIVYPGAIPLDTDILSLSRNAMIAIGYALRATIGTGIFADGLACLPTLPASMQVTVGPGSLMTTSTIDASAYGTLALDLDPLVKMGINPYGSTSFTLTAPGTSGQTINYLIEAQLVEADNLPLSLPYYNASNPSQPFTGPNNNNALQNTVRTQRVGLQLKAGSPAAAGTQLTPAVDAGWVGLYVITVNFAQTTVPSTSIAVYLNAPFISAKIPSLAPLFSPALTGTPTTPTPTPGVFNTQVANMAALATFGHAPSIITFSASGTWVVPAGVTKAKIIVTGGGGGGASNAFNQAGAAGAAGGTTIATIAVSGSMAVVVGAAGVGAAGSTTNGSAGGQSSFGGVLFATGGGGGNNAGTGQLNGGIGGAGSGGAINLRGGDGADGGLSNTTTVGGNGGASYWGGGGRTGSVGVSAGFGEAAGSGGGGGYGATLIGGGSGAAGIVVIEF